MAEAAKRRRTAPTEPLPHAEDGQVCTVAFCPICLAVTAVQPLKPEAVDHLLKAGRELLLAMTSILAARTGEGEHERSRSTLTRIDIE